MYLSSSVSHFISGPQFSQVNTDFIFYFFNLSVCICVFLRPISVVRFPAQELSTIISSTIVFLAVSCRADIKIIDHRAENFLSAQFADQLMDGAMSQGGDSGSAVLDESNNLVGLLFAGSDTTTIMNRIQNVFSELGVTL